jgi:hypothetical protein
MNIKRTIILPLDIAREWNMVCHVKGRTQIEGVWEQTAEEGWSYGRLGKLHNGEVRNLYCVRFQVLSEASMKIRAFWDAADRHIRSAYHLHHQGDDEQYAPLKRWSTPRRLHGATSQKALFFTICTVHQTFWGRTNDMRVRSARGDEKCVQNVQR